MIIFSSATICLSVALSLLGVSADIQGTDSNKTDGTSNKSERIEVVPIVPPTHEDGIQADSGDSTEVIPDSAKDLHERDLEAERKAFQEKQEKYEKELLELENDRTTFASLREEFRLKKEREENEMKKKETIEEEMDALKKNLAELESAESDLEVEKGKLVKDSETLEESKKKATEEEEELKKNLEELAKMEDDLKKEIQILESNKEMYNDLKDLAAYEKELQKNLGKCSDLPAKLKQAFVDLGMNVEGAKICYEEQLIFP